MKYLLRTVREWFVLGLFRGKWKKFNKHNDTFPNNVFPIEHVKVGNHTYGVLNIYSYRNEKELLEIGSFCSIASDVIFILSGEHRISGVSTYPFGEKIFRDVRYVAECKGPIRIEDDVWIGVRSTILSGVTIGQGSVIGANSLVYKDIPPYSVYAGNRIIRSRFNQEIINKLSLINFGAFTVSDIENYKRYLECDVTEENIDEILSVFPLKRGN